MDLVDRTLKEWRSSPFVYGQTDCLLSVGSYMAAVSGFDLTGEFRGRYDDEAGAMALCEAGGGPCALMDRYGWPETANPRRGDVAVIQAGEYELPALFTGAGYVVRRDRGTAEVDQRFVNVIKVWSCPN